VFFSTPKGIGDVSKVVGDRFQLSTKVIIFAFKVILWMMIQ
jgi:hypothetical protein